MDTARHLFSRIFSRPVVCALIALSTVGLWQSFFALPLVEAKQPRVTVCHKAAKKFFPITVAARAVPAHIAHGDQALGACTVGVGACAKEGQLVCKVAGPVCDATPGSPSAEVCGDSIDNDCDGVVDNGC